MKKRVIKGSNIQDLYIKNNIALQAKITELLISINSLIDKLNKIANVFERAESELKQKAQPGIEPLIKKVEELDKQNKAIADTLISLEKYFEEKPMPPTRQIPQTQPPMQRPPFPPRRPPI